MNNKTYLPTRDFLRQLIGQQYVKPNELKNILRSRGVFTSNEDKKLLGSTLIKTGLSPEEYIELRSSYKTKEDNPKILTRQIKWSSETSLFDALESDINFDELLDDNFGTIRLSYQSNFIQPNNKNPNIVRLDFEIERKDITKNWGDNTTYHKGYIELSKDTTTLDLQLNFCHSSKETKEFGNKITKHIINKFKKDRHIIDDEEILSIRFHDFDNMGRVNFLHKLSFDWRLNELYFQDTKDLQFSPDGLDDKAPDELKWMKDKIEDLKLKGKDIHSTFFVSNKNYHKYIKLYKISCDYKFSTPDYEGTCRINYEFHDVDSLNSELNVDVVNLNLSTNKTNITRDAIKISLLRLLDTKKIELYKTHSIRKTPKNLLPNN
ncbi:GapS4b family protein [Providencia stuartii]|uniref:GapS4b family protein n=1 Tax=Providencia stuartii TaxID=588 RepID=UPI00264F703D|nr:hypothetical protein [Providencia stuartii]MDN7223072.1 hypothetical protein [Providencia stuartii]